MNLQRKITMNSVNRINEFKRHEKKKEIGKFWKEFYLSSRRQTQNQKQIFIFQNSLKLQIDI